LPISVANQAYVFLCSVAGGIIIAFIYDVFRIKRKAVRTRSLVIQFEDLIFWIIVAVVMFGVVYYSNEGEIRGYIFIGTIIGVILYVLLLSNIIMKVSLFILKIIYRILKGIWIVVSFPFKILFKVFSIPMQFFLKISRKGVRRARNITRNRLTKAAFWKKVRKNIKKKV